MAYSPQIGDRVLVIPPVANFNRRHSTVRSGTVSTISERGTIFVKYDDSVAAFGDMATGQVVFPEQLSPEVL